MYYHVDFENGQKTGFFLDQKYNRRAVARIAAGHTVLDCFTPTGSFALNAAMGGAVKTLSVAPQIYVELTPLKGLSFKSLLGGYFRNMKESFYLFPG